MFQKSFWSTSLDPDGNLTVTHLSRRAVLAGSAAAAATMSGASIQPAMAQAPPASHNIKVGTAEVVVVTDGTMSMPLDWVLPGRPREEISAVFKDDGRVLGELTIQVNVAIIRNGSEVILIDTGAGPDFAPQRGKLSDNLGKAGVKPEDITRVVFTHAHPDHLWGVIDPLDGGTAFAKARHLMPAAEVDYWSKPGMESGVPEAVRGGAIGTQRRMKELGSRIETFKAGAEIAPGLSAIDTSGHTPGHVSYILQSGSERLAIGGDALIEPTVSFAMPSWRWGADWDADRGVAARLRLLDMLASERIPLLGYHLPWPGLGRVEKRAAAAASYRFIQG